MREPGRLMHSKLQVRPGVGRDVEKHANGGGVAPVLVEGFTIRVGAKRLPQCRSRLGFGSGHANVVDNLVNQTLLGELNGSTFALEVNAKEAKHISLGFQCQVIAQGFELLDISFNQCVIRAEPDLVIAVIQDHDGFGLVDEEARIRLGGFKS